VHGCCCPQVDHHTSTTLQPRDILALFRESLRATGSTHFSASPATCAHQLLELGVVGTRHNRLLHERPLAPPYDEFVLLEESWKGMKRVIVVGAGCRARCGVVVRLILRAHHDRVRTCVAILWMQCI
jgi:hypothetical protein